MGEPSPTEASDQEYDAYNSHEARTSDLFLDTVDPTSTTWTPRWALTLTPRERLKVMHKDFFPSRNPELESWVGIPTFNESIFNIDDFNPDSMDSGRIINHSADDFGENLEKEIGKLQKEIQSKILDATGKLIQERLSQYGSSGSDDSTATTTTTLTATTTPTTTTGAIISPSFLKEESNSTIEAFHIENIPFFVVIATSVAIVSSIFVLLLVIMNKLSKRTQNQSPRVERSSSLMMETNNEYETSIMMESPTITESTESLAESTSSFMDLWKRIKEDDNYQPTYTPSTNAPLAAVLQSTNDV